MLRFTINSNSTFISITPNKLARTFTTQMEALKKYRTGGERKMTVEHVTVNEGGQAIVGNVSRGGQKKKSRATP